MGASKKANCGQICINYFCQNCDDIRTFVSEAPVYATLISKNIISVDYFLKQQENTIMSTLVARGSIPALNKADIDKIMIPLPPLPVQREIVRILDNFTELTAELTAELAARRKQYEHYRDELLTFGDEVPKMPIAQCTERIFLFLRFFDPYLYPLRLGHIVDVLIHSVCAFMLHAACGMGIYIKCECRRLVSKVFLYSFDVIAGL